MKKVCLLTNIPAPYREPVHERVSEQFGDNYTVIYFSKNEVNRAWKFELGDYNFIILKSIYYKIKDRIIHFNPNIIKTLQRQNPDIIIVAGLGPSALLSIFWAKIRRRKVIPFTDATLLSEKLMNLSKLKTYLRRLIYKNADACIGASLASIELFEYYGADKSKIFKSDLCIDNKYFDEIYHANKSKVSRVYDIIYSGRLTERKNITFFIEVVKELKSVKPDLTVLIMGDGELKDRMFNDFKKNNIKFHYAGFVQQPDLPLYYMQSKLFLLPTKQDPWALVCNEAAAVGTPTVISNYAGAANDLVLHNETGLVLELDITLWVEKISYLLKNKEELERLSIKAKTHVENYNFDNAANGIVNAINHVI